MGTDAFRQRAANKRTQEKMADSRQLHRIQDAQIEYSLLKHCICTRITHLCRTLPPDLMTDALATYEAAIKAECRRQFKAQNTLTDFQFQLAKQPVRGIGMGLQDLPLTKDAAYVSAQGALARLANTLNDRDAFRQVLINQSIDDKLRDTISDLATRINDDQDANSNLCPSHDAIKEMPSQHVLSSKLYKLKEEELISLAADPADKAWLRSLSGFNSGGWLAAVPALKEFRMSSASFRTACQLRLMLPLTATHDLHTCACTDRTVTRDELKSGRHYITRCMKNLRTERHDAINKEARRMYRTELAAIVSLDPCYIITTANRERGADLVVPASVHGTSKDLALDFTVTSVDNKDIIRQGSANTQFKAADAAELRKMRQWEASLQRLNPPHTLASVPFEKVPLAMESTGAWGKGMQRWWKNQVLTRLEQLEEDPDKPRRAQGLPHTWSANTFGTYWLQRFSVTFQRHLAESITGTASSARYTSAGLRARRSSG